MNNVKRGLKGISVLKKLLISYVLILLLLIASNLLIFNRASEVLVEKEITYNKMSLNYTRDILDQNIKEIYNSCVALLKNNDTMRRIAKMDKVWNQTILIDRLMEFTQKNSLVEHAVLFNPTLDYVLYEDGGMNAEKAFGSYFQYQNLHGEKLPDKLNQASIGYVSGTGMYLSTKPAGLSESYVTIYFSPQYINGNNKLILMLPESKLRDLFKSAYSQNKFMIVSQNGEVVVDARNQSRPEGLLESLTESIKLGSEAGQFDYGSYLVIHEKSEVFDWEYTVMVNYDYILKDINAIRNIITYLIITVLLLSLLIISLSVKNNYVPLKEILSYVGNGNEKENEFEKIKSGIITLKKHNSTYRENQVLQDMIRNGGSRAELEKLFPCPLALGILVVGKEQELISVLKNSLEQALVPENGSGVRLISGGRDQVYVVINVQKLEIELVKEAVLNFFAGNPSSLLIGMGTIEQKGDLKLSCDHAEAAFLEARISDPGPIYSWDIGGRIQEIYMPIDLESRMLSFIYAANREKVKELVDEVFDRNRDISRSQLKKLIMDFANIYIKLAQKVGCGADIKKAEEVLEREYQFDKLKDCIYWLYVGLVYEEPVDKRADYVGKYIKDYVQHHYMDSTVSIETIASMLNLVPTYVSTLFKKEAKVSFSQYLSDYRIEQAKYLLEHTDKKVKDIASETGFGTYNNFTRVFKKKLGVTPIEYKNHKQS